MPSPLGRGTRSRGCVFLVSGVGADGAFFGNSLAYFVTTFLDDQKVATSSHHTREQMSKTNIPKSEGIRIFL